MFKSNEEKREMVLKGNLYKGLLILSLPIIFNNIMQTLYNLVDTYWVGRISDTNIEVGAVGGVFPVTHIILAFGMGVYITAVSLMSQNVGADNKKQANFIASQSFGFSIILGLVMMIFGLMFIPTIVGTMMGFKGETYQLGVDYLSILFYEIPFIFGLLIFTAMRQSNGDTLTPVIFTVGSVLLNVVLDPIFIIHLDMGVKGAAWATVLSKAVIVPFWLLMAFFDRKGIHLNLKDLIPNPKMIKKIIKISIPASFGQSINAAGFVVLQVFVYGYGTATLSAFTVTNRINSLAMMPAMGIGSALAFYIGQNIGNQNYDRAKKAFRASMIMSTGFGLAGMALMLMDSTGKFMMQLFLSGDETIDLAIYFLAFVAFNIPLMGAFQSLMGVFQGAGKTTYVFILSVARLWLMRIPMIYILQNYTDIGSITLYISMISSNVLVIILGYYLYHRGKWQKRIIETDSDSLQLVAE